MFRKSRRKIVASIMGALILLFAATLSAIVLSEFFENRRQSRDMLQRYIDLYSVDQLPGTAEGPAGPPPDAQQPLPEAHLYQVSTFYSVAVSDSREVLAVDSGKSGLYSTDELIRVARGILQGGKAFGRTSALRYQVEKREGYTLVALMDNTVTDDSFRSLVRHTWIVGGIAMAVCFFAADYSAFRIVKPLEENDRQQRQFVSDAGHELKTPISVISANAELLSRQLGSNQWLDNMRYENKRMGELVTQLLDLSRAEQAHMPMEELDLSRLVTGEALPFESVAFEKGLSLQSEITDGIQIEAVRAQISQLVSILLDNAIRHTEGGKEIELSLRRQGRHALLTVENYGKEIPPEEQTRIFERFYRLDAARTGEGNQYGLGLAIARAIIEAHDGSISVACREGKVIFTATLPVKNDSEISM